VVFLLVHFDEYSQRQQIFCLVGSSAVPTIAQTVDRRDRALVFFFGMDDPQRVLLRQFGSMRPTRGAEPIKAVLSPWPVERPANWAARVDAPLATKELDRVRVSIERGRPYGEQKWVRETIKDLGSQQTVRPEGRPRKASQSATEATI